MPHKPTRLYILTILIMLPMILLLIWHVQQGNSDSPSMTLVSNLKTGPRLKLDFQASLSTPADHTFREIIDCTNLQESVIHLAFVATGYEMSKSIVTVLKSILFYRRTPLYLHLIVDKPAQLILETLLQTWQLPLFNYSFYSIDKMEQKVKSNAGGLIIALPSILPSSVENVIVLDPNVIVVTNIKYLWNYLPLMHREGKMIGMVENQHSSSLPLSGHKLLPAQGRGFNTGVMLMDLKSMKEDDQWNLIEYTSFDDENVVDAFIKDHPNFVYTLPCNWNIQISKSASTDCYMQTYEHNIIHWELANIQGAHFRSIYDTFVQHDGNLLRHVVLSCEDKKRSLMDVPAPDNVCAPIEAQSSIVYRTHLYYYGQQYTTSSDNDVTLVTQLSFSRLTTFQSILNHWEGPMSLAVYVTDSEAVQLETYLKKVKAFKERENIAIHLVYEYGTFYPVNYLRNIALRNVGTPYVFLMDVDFIPMFDLYEHLKTSVTLIMQPSRHKQALIVAAFEAVNFKFAYPESKKDLLQMIHNGTIQKFKEGVWDAGHSSTNYKKWYEASKAYKAKWSEYYEPYILVHKDVSPYDERFLSVVGWDKVTHTHELRAQGYQFIVLPEAFIIHSPHTPMLEVTYKELYKKCFEEMQKRFKKELVRKYGRRYGRKQRKYVKH